MHYTGPKNRLSRREGLDLFGKGTKLRRATVPPGQHGPKGSRRLSDYGVRLREKQKLKRIYGVTERQFQKYFAVATKVRGKTGEVLLRILETRLDNVIYRLGFTPTRAMARQLVSHGHVNIANAKVSIPSYQVKPGQVVTLSPTSVKIPQVLTRLDSTDFHPPAWLQRQAAAGVVLSLPERSLIEAPVDEQLIVEFYSR
ncbi:MAG: small subunit ribosomal protein S4 [Microgenomates group bacterium Gr01-1014_16]|nr:MAG: small subunit ribosomal protein S4 [Microgenomates group bacterium Gr01-1014_16]